jgi:transposase InsO family protein
VAESFFATLKVELVHDALWPTRAAARAAVFEYIEILYNQQRRHSSLRWPSSVSGISSTERHNAGVHQTGQPQEIWLRRQAPGGGIIAANDRSELDRIKQ